MSFSPCLQNISFPPPCLYFHHYCPVQLSRVLCRLLRNGWTHLWLPLVYPDDLVAQIPVWAQLQRGPGHPGQVSPIQALALCSCHIASVQPFHSLKGSGFQRLFCEACTLILQMSVLLIHFEFPGAAQARLFPSRKPSQIVPSFWEHWFCSERRKGGEVKGEKGSPREEGKEEKGKGNERAGENSGRAWPHNTSYEFTRCRWKRGSSWSQTGLGSNLSSSLSCQCDLGQDTSPL